ncbi:MAG: glycosyltransferase family 4 protein [Microbacterium sp.]
MTHHIAFVVNNYPPRVGGVEKHVGALAAHLVRLGHRVTVFTLADRPGVTTEDGVRVHRLPRRLPVADVIAFPPPGTTRRLTAALRSSGVTVVSTHTRFFPLTWIGTRAARRAGIPSIHTEHGSDFVRASSRLVEFASRLVDRTLGRAALRRSSRVLAVSQDAADFVERLSGVESTLFYNAIDLDEWRVPGAVSAAAPSRVVFVGRLVPGKGWDTFLAACAALRDTMRERGIRAHVLGGGPDAQKCRDAVEAYGIGDITDLHGTVDSAFVREMLTGAVLVNASVLAEGFGITLLEATAVGAQIVSYPIPAAPVLAEHGAPVRIVDPPSVDELARQVADALEHPLPLITDEDLATWSWETRARQYADLVDEVVARDARPN